MQRLKYCEFSTAHFTTFVIQIFCFQVFNSPFWFRRVPNRARDCDFPRVIWRLANSYAINDRSRFSNTNLSVTDISVSYIRVTIVRFPIRRVKAKPINICWVRWVRWVTRLSWNLKISFIQLFIKLPVVELLINHECNDDRNSVMQFARGLWLSKRLKFKLSHSVRCTIKKEL